MAPRRKAQYVTEGEEKAPKKRVDDEYEYYSEEEGEGGVEMGPLGFLSSYEESVEGETDDGEGADESDIIVSLKNVHKTYLLGVEGVPALRGVSATIRRGEFVVIFGTSGGGKTSMLNIIGTIDRPTKGEVIIGGVRVNNATPDRELANIRLNRLGFVFQTFNLLPSLSAIDNVTLPMVLKGVLSPSERTARGKHVLGQVGMSHREKHYPSMLSGGEQQRVTIARAIGNQPDLLLLDEPTGDLDHQNSNSVMKVLLDLNIRDGITLVMVTHDVNLKAFADRVIWMRDGKISRVEHVDPSSKAAAIANLDQEIAEAAALAAESDPNNENGAAGAKREITYNHTVVRTPKFYTPVHAVHSKAGKQELKRRVAMVDDPSLFAHANAQVDETGKKQAAINSARNPVRKGRKSSGRRRKRRGAGTSSSIRTSSSLGDNVVAPPPAVDGFVEPQVDAFSTSSFYSYLDES